MRVFDVVRLVAGASVVYLAMAACGSSDDAAPANGGTSIVNPVPTAQAADDAGNGTSGGATPLAQVEYFDEACDKTYSTGGGGKNSFAEHQFAGVSANDLTREVVALAKLSDKAVRPAGYTGQAAPTWVKDGAVAVTCTGDYTSVTFIRTH